VQHNKEKKQGGSTSSANLGRRPVPGGEESQPGKRGIDLSGVIKSVSDNTIGRIQTMENFHRRISWHYEK